MLVAHITSCGATHFQEQMDVHAQYLILSLYVIFNQLMATLFLVKILFSDNGMPLMGNCNCFGSVLFILTFLHFKLMF